MSIITYHFMVNTEFYEKKDNINKYGENFTEAIEIYRLIKEKEPDGIIISIISVMFVTCPYTNENWIEHLFVNMYYENTKNISYDSWLNLGYIDGRMDYIKFITGSLYSSNKIENYLFDQFFSREICSFICSDNYSVLFNFHNKDKTKFGSWYVRKHISNEDMRINSYHSCIFYINYDDVTINEKISKLETTKCVNGIPNLLKNSYIYVMNEKTGELL